MIKFDVHSRFTGAVQFAAKIDCAEDAPRGVNLRLAVFWAIKNGANLRGADLRGADLSFADLSFADLSCADMRDANLRGADLRGADLSFADLSFADLSCADMRDAGLSCADMSRANMSGADLSCANLRGADLRRANMSGANMSGADLRGHKIKRLIARITRISDGCEAQVYETEAGEIVGKWGCKTLTLAAFTSHAESYDDPDKRAETLNIIAYVRAEAERLGVK